MKTKKEHAKTVESQGKPRKNAENHGNQEEPTKKNEDRATIKVKISAKIKASGIFFLKKSVKI